MSISFGICAGIALVSSLVSLGYAIAGSRAARGDSVTPSGYALARSVALAAVAVAAPFTGSRGFVAAIALAMVIVQAADAVVGTTL